MSTPSDPDLSALSPLASQLATTIARVASDIALVIDKDGVISAVAEGAAVQSHGCQKWLGQRWIDTVSASTRPKLQSLLDEVASSGVGTRRREVSHLSGNAGNGQELPVTWAAIRLGADGPVLAVGRDMRAVAAIQQRFVEAQQDMERHYWNRRQTEARDRLLFQAVHDGLLVLDAHSLQLQQVNAAAAELLGQEQTGMTGRLLNDVLPPSAWLAVSQLLSTVLGTGRAGEIRVRGDGLTGPLDISATALPAGEQPLLLLRLRRHEITTGDGDAAQRMAVFVASTPEAVVITDLVGVVLLANPAFLRLIRLGDETQLRGKLLPDLLLDSDGALGRLMLRARQQGLVAGENLEVGSRDGQPQTVQLTAALLTEGEQPCLCFILRPGHRLPAHQAGDDLLAGLLDEVGRVPLADLLVEVAHRAERQLIDNALLRTGGQRDAAAKALGLSPQALALRMHRHGLSGHDLLPGQDPNPPALN